MTASNLEILISYVMIKIEKGESLFLQGKVIEIFKARIGGSQASNFLFPMGIGR
jgi:hypothetical protein